MTVRSNVEFKNSPCSAEENVRVQLICIEYDGVVRLAVRENIKLTGEVVVYTGASRFN